MSRDIFMLCQAQRAERTQASTQRLFRLPYVKKPTMTTSSNPPTKAGVPRTGLVWGDRRGHQTQRRVLPPRRVNKKAVASERVKTIRSVIREVSGFAPYERRAMELIRNSKVC